MTIKECRGKQIKVFCTDGTIITGYCDDYLSAFEAEAEDLRGACIYISKGERALIEIFEDEIASIEEIK